LTSILLEIYEKIQTKSRITRFIKTFNIVNLLKACGLKKERGISIIKLVEFLITMVFTHKNLFRIMNNESETVPFAKDTVYRILNNPNTDWRQMQLKLGSETINKYLDPLTHETRVRALVFDDSAYYRDRSKKVEILAWVKDHVTGRYFKGFRKLTAGWTDGATFIPLAFSLLSSPNNENCLYEQRPDIPNGSHGEKHQVYDKICWKTRGKRYKEIEWKWHKRVYV
jgi:hypothetical protein